MINVLKFLQQNINEVYYTGRLPKVTAYSVVGVVCIMFWGGLGLLVL